MDVKVLWSDNAINQLEHIFDYYKYNASLKVSRKIVLQILDRTLLIEKNPFIGKKDPLLQHRKKEYRFIIKGNYKIIYFVPSVRVFKSLTSRFTSYGRTRSDDLKVSRTRQCRKAID